MGMVFSRAPRGGAAWLSRGSGLPPGIQVTLAMDPQTPTTLYAGTPQNTPGFSGGAPLSSLGVFKTVDGGANWNRSDSGVRQS